MKLSCLPVSFYRDITSGRMTLGDWARMGARLGLDGVDVSIVFFPDRTPEALAEARRQFEDASIALYMMSTYPDFTHPEAAQRARELDLAVKSVALCAALGVRAVRLVAGQAHPQTGREQGIAWAAEGMRRLAERTRGSGVALVYENHVKGGPWVYNDFSLQADVFLAIVEATADCGLGVNFDIGNATAFVPDPLGLLEQVLPRVVSVHASETGARGALTPAVVGQGLVDYPAFFRRLRQAGWDGWISIEEASGQGPAAVEYAVQFVRQAWEESAA